MSTSTNTSIPDYSRTPHGVRGLKYRNPWSGGTHLWSHPSRGAWIEILLVCPEKTKSGSHPSRGAWIEMYFRHRTAMFFMSHPSRGAWIEIWALRRLSRTDRVAPLTGCVD